MPTRRKPGNAPSVKDQLASVDWLRLMQRVGVFLRDLRGDDPRDIQDDHVESLDGSQRLRRYAEHMAGKPHDWAKNLDPQPNARSARTKR